MAKKRKRKSVPTLGTIWEISDDLWERIRPILEEFWPKKATLIEECEDLSGVYWDWQSADGAMAKARFGGIVSVRTPRIAGKTARNAACSSMSMADLLA